MLYQRALAGRFRSLPIDHLTASRGGEVALAAVYTERPLVPLGAAAPMPAALPTLAALAREPGARVLLSAGPGLGKSVALRRLALACAAHTAGQLDATGGLLDDWAAPIPLPLLVERTAELAEARGDDLCGGLVESWLRADGLEEFAPEVERALAAGECLVLMDGAHHAPAAAALEALVARFPANRFIAAARPGAVLPGFAPYTLPPLDKPLMNEMVARWYTALAPSSGSLSDRIASLQGRLLPDDRLLDLAFWPLALVLCVLADLDGVPLPRARADVYAGLLDLLLDRRGALPLAEALGLPGLDTCERRLALLGPLALALQQGAAPDGATPALPRAEAEQLLLAGVAPFGGDERAAQALAERCLHAGLLEATPSGELAIPRPALREHLAGRVLAAAPDLQERAAILRADARWRPTLRQAARERDRAAPGASFALVRDMLAHGQREEILLAAECLCDLDEAAARAPDLANELRGRLLDMLGDARAPLPERIRAGLLLGEIGDPRFDDLLPPLAFVEGGSFLLGASVAGFDDEGPPQRIDVPAFRIGVFPVTNREYARFLADHPEHPLPHYWHDPRFNNPSLPAVGVTWHDAAAYCAWLTGRLACEGRLPSGTVVRLPLEAEWEKAATWGPGARRKHAFPWGNTWDAARANTAEGRGAWLTTPVGAYPAGVSQYGVYDMIGNVWEWTASEYASYPGGTPQRRKGYYVLRGSSCVSLPTNARATYRGSHLPPHYWRYHLGFRLVIGRPLPQPPDDQV
ncbi:MAG TPA: SUMF1/EgtB/PvdO family nonheme iron enzyme [Roseiflexaceae bacterium]|nr:SUMF1/EgtB/PvdO family nonheme iron enzyme [Roseiflexaceae bacterium]